MAIFKLIIIRTKFLENYSFLIDQLSLCEKCIESIFELVFVRACGDLQKHTAVCLSAKQ